MDPLRAVSLLRQFRSNWALAFRHARCHGYTLFFAYTDIPWAGW